MDFISREELLALTGVPVATVYLPMVKKHVCIVGMTGKERDSFEATLVTGRGKNRVVNTNNMRAKLAARCIYDKPPADGGRRMFSDEEADRLGDIRVDALSPLFNKAQELSGVTDDDLEELGKASSERTTSDTSSSR